MESAYSPVEEHVVAAVPCHEWIIKKSATDNVLKHPDLNADSVSTMRDNPTQLRGGARLSFGVETAENGRLSYFHVLICQVHSLPVLIGLVDKRLFLANMAEV
jgi:hypothetical protein